MTTLFARHQVKDFTVWRQGYQNAGTLQQQAGVVADAVYQAEDDPNDVTVMHDFKSAAEAKAFAGSAKLREAMQEAGVVGAPTIWFAHKA